MKNGILTLCSLLYFLPFSFAQKISIENERENVFYWGIDNSLTVVVENLSCKQIKVKTNNGRLTGRDGYYVLQPERVGPADITVYKISNSKLTELGKKTFRVKAIPDAVFKIGSGKDLINKIELQNQQFVRAEVEYGYDINYSVDSFTVCIISSDTCKYSEKLNIGGQLNKAIIAEFQSLKKNDIVIFKNIFGTGPDGQRRLMPRMITILE